MKNLHFHEKTVTTQEKAQKNGHNPCVVWLTGLSGSGKSTIANELEKKLFSMGVQTHVLDGDNVRQGLNRDLGFLPHERKENIRRIGEVANLFAQSGTVVITAFISPYDEDREAARASCSERFLVVHVDADLATCEKRDPKGLYKKARAGLISEFTGVSAPYEKPKLKPQHTMAVNSSNSSVEDCVNAITEELFELDIFGVES